MKDLQFTPDSHITFEIRELQRPELETIRTWENLLPLISHRNALSGSESQIISSPNIMLWKLAQDYWRLC